MSHSPYFSALRVITHLLCVRWAVIGGLAACGAHVLFSVEIAEAQTIEPGDRQAFVELLPPIPPEPVNEDVDRVFTDPDDDARMREIAAEMFYELQRQRDAEDAEKKRLADEQSLHDLTMKGYWKDGLSFETKDKAYKVHVGGRVQFDSSFFGVPQDIQTDPRIINQWGDGVDFRRVRIKVDGTMYEFIDWAMQFDMMNSTRDGTNVKPIPAVTDLWWTFTKLPVVGNWRTGNIKEPIGFEHLVSSRFLPFMERSFNQDAFFGGFNNGFTPGSMFFNTACDEHMTWAIGVFKPTRNVFAASTNTGDWATTGRLTFLPYYEDEGKQFIHLGASGRFASTFDHVIQFRTRGPERSGISAQWPLPADTGNFFGDRMTWANVELAAVNGPWTLQAEYLTSWVQDNVMTGAGVPTDNVMFHGGYIQLMRFLTGEHDHYSRKSAVFERVVPLDNANITAFGSSQNWPWGWLSCGAWQAGVRYNYLDLNDADIHGNVLQDVTCGLNWFLSPNMKVQWNYSATHRSTFTKTHEGFIHGFGIRLAHDF